MKRIRVFNFLFLLLLLNLNFCSDNSDDEGAYIWTVDSTKSLLYDSSAWIKVYYDVRYDTTNSTAYVSKDFRHVSDETIKNCVDEFNNNIYPKVTNYFASPLDVDGNQKIILAFIDIQDGYSYTKPASGGYFYPGDLFSKETIAEYNNIYGTNIHTNEAEIIFIDIVFLEYIDMLTDKNTANSIIAHEFQHLVNASEKLRNNYSQSETWLTEGLSMAAEHLCYGELKDRIDHFNENYEDTVKNGYSLFYWEQSDMNKLLLNYSSSYLFLQYLRSQSSGKNDIFKNIIQDSSGDYRSVTYAMDLDANFSNSDIWGPWYSDKFNRLILRWFATNAGISNNDLYKYDDEIETIPSAPLYTSNSVNLRSGAGIVKTMSEEFDSNYNNYIYLSVNSDGSNEDFEQPYEARDKFVAVNMSYTPDDDDETYTELPNSIISKNFKILNNVIIKKFDKENVMIPDALQKFDMNILLNK